MRLLYGVIVKPVDLGLSKARTQFQLQANLKRVAINLCSPEIDIANVSVKGLVLSYAYCATVCQCLV